jgi:serine/threonine protein kinase
MSPDQYRQVGQLYHAALELEPEQRVAFLDGACGGNDELRREVESLLQARERAGNFLAAPALEVAAEMLADRKEPSLVGRDISHYQVLSLIGAGGMGEVYLAQDSSLGRKVALKLLPAAFTQDRERVRRFEREARSVSALNHPNIVTIYEVGQVEGRHFIAAEYIEGQTLRQQLASGQFKAMEALEAAMQIASALTAAHEAGIMHRDIKPENVMLRRDGIIKVLDFGLAKLVEKRPFGQTTVADSDSPTEARVRTQPGVVLGTVAYMSPEQARGEELDERTDIFSLGVTLYELVAGRPPFTGSNPAEMLAAILREEPPPLHRFSRESTAELERIVTKALAKKRDERYQTVKDLLLDLKNLKLELEFATRLNRVDLSATTKRPRQIGRPQTTEPPPVSQDTPLSDSTALREMMEPVGGAVPLESKFYITRPADEKFRAAIARHDSIVLVKGARQVGKTSLLARGLQQAREAGASVVLTDFQNLSSADLQSFEKLLLSFADSFADQLDLDVSPGQLWKADRSPGINFEQYLRREALLKTSSQIIWGLDEVDRLFTCDFGSEVFGLFRSWHNKRALDPAGPWRRLTLAIAYATEAHLFITDLNQSPFNVGTRLQLEDFSFDQVTELNSRCGSPLRNPAEVARFQRLVGGHPYLARRGLHEMVTEKLDLGALEARADQDEGPFGDHLRRILVSLTQDAALSEVVRGVLQGKPCPTPETFYRLRSAGLIAGDSASDARPRCQLYATYLEKRLL